MQQFKRLEDYLKLNGGLEMYCVQMRGACLFASLRRSIDCPLEYSNTHLRRQIVVTVTKNPEFFWPMLALHIKGNFGHIRLSKSVYDKRSLVGYLRALLKRKFWGEEMVLMIVSMMWQVSLTVITRETLRSIKFRHSNALPKADIVVIWREPLCSSW